MRKPYIKGFVLVVLFITGCSYSLRMNQYPHLKDVMVSSLENQTLELHLEEDMRNSLINSFQQDGRLRIAYDNPDGQIEGEIIEYGNTIYGYDLDENIEEYQVTLLISVRFTDLVRNEIIYENKTLSLVERYSPQATEAVKFKSEEEAVNQIFKELFNIIIRNSLEAW